MRTKGNQNSFKSKPFLRNELQSMQNQRIQIFHLPTIHLNRTLNKERRCNEVEKKLQTKTYIRRKVIKKTQTPKMRLKQTFGEIDRVVAIVIDGGDFTRADLEEIIFEVLGKIDGPIRFEVSIRLQNVESAALAAASALVAHLRSSRSKKPIMGKEAECPKSERRRKSAQNRGIRVLVWKETLAEGEGERENRTLLEFRRERERVREGFWNSKFSTRVVSRSFVE